MLRRDQFAVVGGVALIFGGAALFVVSKGPSDDIRSLKVVSSREAAQTNSHLPLRELSPEELNQVLENRSDPGSIAVTSRDGATMPPTPQAPAPAAEPRQADVVADPYARMREYRAKLSDDEFVALRKRKQEEYLASVVTLEPSQQVTPELTAGHTPASENTANPYAELRARIAEERKQLDEEQLAAERRARFQRYVDNAARSSGSTSPDDR